MKASSNYKLREIIDEILLIPVGTSSVRLTGMIVLNKTGAFIFNALSEDRTVDELTEMVIAEYGISAETARADVEEFLQELREIDALIEE